MRITMTAVALTFALGSLGAAASAQTATATRSVTMQGLGANHAAPTLEARNQQRREQTYRTYYHHKFGANPSDKQVREWYVRTYHKAPV
jgi:hypothetical protein